MNKQYVIIWDFIDNDGMVHLAQELPFEDKDAANDMWKKMKGNSCYANMRHEIREREEKPAEKKYIAIRVQFVKGGKVYTYLAKSKVEVGSMVVVWTSEGRELVDVVECCEMTRKELEAICDFSRFQYIKGKVVAA